MKKKNFSDKRNGISHIIEDNLTLWTALTPKERVRGVRWFASRPVAEQADMIDHGVQQIFPRLQKQNPEAVHENILRYAAFVLAIRQAGFDLVRKRGYRTMGHKDFEKFEALRQGTLRSLKNDKKAPVRQLLLTYWGDVKALKDGGTGFLLIARYLQRAHNVKVSPRYIAYLWKEFEACHGL